MPVFSFFAGETTHTIGKRRRRFKPRGAIRVIGEAASSSAWRGRSSRAPRSASEDVSRLSSGGLSARLFVGLNVGQTQKWTADDVTRIVYETRKAQGEVADASILMQQGIYEDRGGNRVVEPSVHVIIIDLSGAEKAKFVAEMKDLAERLRVALEQEVVILEIQKKGIVTDVYSAAAST